MNPSVIRLHQREHVRYLVPQRNTLKRPSDHRLSTLRASLNRKGISVHEGTVNSNIVNNCGLGLLTSAQSTPSVRRIKPVRAEMAESDSRGGYASRAGLWQNRWQGRGGNRSPSESLPPSTSMMHDQPQSNPQPQHHAQPKDSNPNPKFQNTVNRNSKMNHRPPPRIRPTHFLALPLHNHPTLRDRIASFQDALFATPQDVKSTGRTEPQPAEAQSKDVATDIPASNESRKTKGKPRKKPTVSQMIQGLDTSIVIDPRRMHMTLGVMALEFGANLEISNERQVQQNDASSSVSSPTPAESKKTVSTALALLATLKPRISEILDGSKGVSVPLETLHVLKTTRISAPSSCERGYRSQVQPAVAESDVGRNETGSEKGKSVVPAGAADDNIPTIVGDSETGNVAAKDFQKEVPEARSSRVLDPGDRDKVGAGVLYIAPRTRKFNNEDKSQKEANEEYRKLVQVCELINKTFKDAGYLTDTRPLTLHCTILNASHRKPARRMPFSYTDILASEAIKLLGVPPSETPENRNSSNAAELNASRTSLSNIPPPSSSVPKQKVEDPSNAVVNTIVGEIEDSTLPAPSSTLRNPLVAVAPKPKYRAPIIVPPPLSVDLGTVRVNEVQIWEMGSHGQNNEYVNCGGIVLE